MRQKLYCLLSVFAVLLLAACMCAGPAAADDFVPDRPYADGRLIIQCEISSDGLSVAESVTVLTDYRDLVPGMMLIETPEGMTVPEAVVYYRNMPGVILAEPDYLNQLPPDDPVVSALPSFSVSAVSGDPATNDTYLSLQWGLETIHAFDAWKIQTGSSNVVVAVIDTGIKYNHEDLAANMWTDGSGHYGYDYVNRDNDPMDDQGHGTHCAGIIGAVGNNGKGVSGVAWNVSLMAVKVLDKRGSGYDSNIIKGIEYAVEHGADIISMSLGGAGYDSSMKTAIDNAGILMVCAAGNENNNTELIPTYPACYTSDNILAVAATDEENQLASYSNYGVVSIDVACPGSNIASTFPSDVDSEYPYSYLYMSGTSMATPMVAGIAALLLSEDPTLTPKQIKQVLMSTVDPYSSLSGKVVTGGIVNASKALESICRTPASIDVTAPTGSLAYKATGTAAAVVKDGNGAVMTDAVVWSSSNPAALTINSATGAYEVIGCAGSVTITAATSNGISDTTTVSLTKGVPSASDFDITVPGSAVYNGEQHPVAVSVKSGVYGMGSVTVLYNGSAAAPVKVGSYPITLNVEAGANYTSASSLSTGRILNISKAAPSSSDFDISIPSGVVYDGQSHTVTASVKSDVYGMGSVTVLYNGSAAAPVKAGSYTITLKVAAGDNYTSASSLSTGQKFVISKAAPSADNFTISGLGDAVYNGKSHTVTAAVKYGVKGMGSVTVLYNGSTTAPVKAGSYPITLKVADGTNYTSASSLATGETLVISKAVPSVSNFTISVPKSSAYNGQSRTVTVSTKSGVKGMGTVTVLYNGSTSAPAGAGSYPITLHIAEGVNYTSVSSLATGQTLTITKATPNVNNFTLTVPSGVVYDGLEHTVTASVKPGLYGMGEVTVLYNGSAAAPIKAGSYTITLNVAEGTNYTSKSSLSTSKTFSISKASPAVSDFDITVPSGVVYDGKSHMVTAAAKSGVYGMGSVTVLYNGSTTAPVKAGSYTITLKVAGGNNFTSASSLVTGETFVISKAVPTADNLSYSLSAVDYDGAAHSVSVTAKGGVLGLGTITVKYDGKKAKPVSAKTYAVTADIAAGTNYSAVNNLALGNFVINKIVPTAADFTVNPAIADVQYDGLEHTFTVTSSNITDGTKTVSYSSGGAAVSAPMECGTYLVNVSVSGASNYTDTADITLGQFEIFMEPEYTVSITSTAGGSASASAESAVSGTLVILTAVPDTGYKLKEWQVVSGGITLIGNTFTMPSHDVEINAVFEIIPFNANETVTIVNQTTPENISTLTVPQYTNPKSGKSILLNDSVVVKAVIGGTEQNLSAKIIDGHVVLDTPGSASGAASVTVEFIGKKLGDSDGDGAVTVNDAVKVAQSLVNIVTMDDKGRFYGDADSDGNITVNDAVKVAQRLVGLVDENYK